jgi:hypothetical protein
MVNFKVLEWIRYESIHYASRAVPEILRMFNKEKLIIYLSQQYWLIFTMNR